MVPPVVDRDADVDGEDGEEDAGERHARELVDELDAHEDDAAHDDKQEGAVDAVVVELDEVVGYVGAEQRHVRTDQVRLEIEEGIKAKMKVVSGRRKTVSYTHLTLPTKA